MNSLINLANKYIEEGTNSSFKKVLQKNLKKLSKGEATRTGQADKFSPLMNEEVWGNKFPKQIRQFGAGNSPKTFREFAFCNVKLMVFALTRQTP